MLVLDYLARLLRVRENDRDVREYVMHHAADLSEAFGTTEENFCAAITSIKDDAQLVRRLATEVQRAHRERRGLRVQQRATAAQLSADVLAGAACWEGDRAYVDVLSLVSACLTREKDSLVFACNEFSISIPQERLFKLARLERYDLTGFIDREGLHVRWSTGGLNFRPRDEGKASKVVFNLPARSVAVAA
jgi:hypothetical protein